MKDGMWDLPEFSKVDISESLARFSDVYAQMLRNASDLSRPSDAHQALMDGLAAASHLNDKCVEAVKEHSRTLVSLISRSHHLHNSAMEEVI